MLTVLKRSGKTEPYNSDKIIASLESVSDEAGCPITEADCHSIILELGEMLEGKCTVRSRELYIMVVGLLSVRRMFTLARRYVERSTYI